MENISGMMVFDENAIMTGAHTSKNNTASINTC